MILKSIPLIFCTEPPSSAVAKKLLREIIASGVQPLHPDEAKIFRRVKIRKRVYLSPKQDSDLIQFFDTAPKSLQYAVFLAFNEKLKKLQEEKP